LITGAVIEGVILACRAIMPRAPACLDLSPSKIFGGMFSKRVFPEIRNVKRGVVAAEMPVLKGTGSPVASWIAKM